MADENPGGLTPGKQTSEFGLAKMGVWIGVILQVISVLGVALVQLQDLFPDAKWIAAVLGICGTMLQAGSIAGYQVSRGIAKSGSSVPTIQPVPGPLNERGFSLTSALLLCMILALLLAPLGCVTKGLVPKPFLDADDLRLKNIGDEHAKWALEGRVTDSVGRPLDEKTLQVRLDNVAAWHRDNGKAHDARRANGEE